MQDELNPNLLRAYLDGELSEEEAGRVEARLAEQPQWGQLLEAEGQLRQRIGSVMGRPLPVPPALRERILANAQADAEAAGGTSAESVEATSRAANVTPAATDSARPGVLAAIWMMFERPHRVSFSAVAAVLILVAAVVLIGVFGQGIDRDPASPNTSALLAAVGEHISREHDRCAADDNALLEKLDAMTREDAASRLPRHLGVESVTVFDLSSIGYRFVGVGPCSLPGGTASAHLVYRRDVAGEPQSIMSIFVAPDIGQFSGECKKHRTDDGGRWSGVCGGKGCSKTILHGSDDNLAYFLACGHADQVHAVSKVLCQSLARRGK